MKLLSSPTSPFVRKVRILIREKSATNRVEEVVVSALSDPAELHEANPLGKVPALILDDGTTLFNSPLICQYLDEELGEPKLLPPIGKSYWVDMRLQTIGDGISEAAVSLTFEKARADGERSLVWMDRWRRAIVRSLDIMEAEASALKDNLSLGHIAVVCALDYLDFRHKDINWRDGRPALTAFHKKTSGRPAFNETLPA
jgi:glutathione S-transferase